MSITIVTITVAFAVTVAVAVVVIVAAFASALPTGKNLWNLAFVDLAKIFSLSARANVFVYASLSDLATGLCPLPPFLPYRSNKSSVKILKIHV